MPDHALEKVQQALSRRPEVEFVEKNQIFAPDFTPDDPYYPNQWHLRKIMAPEAWEITRGASEIIIAVLDTGVDPTHPDLAAKLVDGYNFYDNNTETSDVYGHGTAVAGSAAAASNNGIGVAGVAGDTLIMPIRISNPQGYAYTSTISKGLTWAVDNGARVMNISFSGVAGSTTIKNAARYVQSQGGVVVAAAGNCGCFDSTPENPYIISVSATDDNDNLAFFSSRGDYVDVAAPGQSILTTTRGGTYGWVSGTSFASPITTGVVALMWSANPDLTPLEIDDLLEGTALDLGDPGYDTSFGFGRVNAQAAVLAAIGSEPQPDTTPPSVSIVSPADGDIVSGDIRVSVSASDDIGVTTVKLDLDGDLLAADTTAPFSFTWDTTPADDGTHTLQAMAYDAAGNAAASAEINVIVQTAVSDTTAPQVAIIFPANGSTVSKLVKIKVQASDDRQMQQVQLFVDGNLFRTATCETESCSLRFNWNTRKEAKGWHRLSAIAHDAAGNEGTSSTVNVDVK